MRRKGQAGLALVVAILVITPIAGPAARAAFAPPARPTSLASNAMSLSDPSPALQIAALDRSLADLDAEERTMRGEMGGLGAAISEAHGRIVAHGKAFYRLTRAGLLPVGGGFDQLVRHALRVERQRRALAVDLSTERALRDRGAELVKMLERNGRDRSALSAQRAAMEQARITAELEARRQSAYDRAFETSTGATADYVPIYAGTPSGAAASTAGFAAARGRLLFPLAAKSEVRPARREGTDGPGLEVRAKLATPVRASFAGRVAFADRYGTYGRILILDHGDHYYTVSGNLGSFDVKVGDEVSAGERIGTVGDEGQGAMLYFEVRHGTETLPPAPWLGLENAAGTAK